MCSSRPEKGSEVKLWETLLDDRLGLQHVLDIQVGVGSCQAEAGLGWSRQESHHFHPLRHQRKENSTTCRFSPSPKRRGWGCVPNRQEDEYCLHVKNLSLIFKKHKKKPVQFLEASMKGRLFPCFLRDACCASQNKFLLSPTRHSAPGFRA